MADGGETLLLRTVASIAEIGRERWDTLADADGEACHPFVAYDFLKALEDSRSVGPGTGWTPAHLALEEAGAVAAIAPLYVKTHSQGEYVFDHHWAEAYERAGGRYYPKLLLGVPFTPVAGPRLLAPVRLKRPLARALVKVAARMGASSLHANFLLPGDAEALGAEGLLSRRDVQFVWINRGYRDYDAFLAALSSRKRKALMKERHDAQEGITIRRLTGKAATPADWDAMWAFYQETGGRKWGRPYLTRAFFTLIAERMADRVLLVVAERAGRRIAGALNFIGNDALYGRYWGAVEHVPFLHFEICYHQAIEEAILRGLSRVEAGAQGEHKLARGYEPVETRSAHFIADASFRVAIERYLKDERAMVADQIAVLRAGSPYRKDVVPKGAS